MVENRGEALSANGRQIRLPDIYGADKMAALVLTLRWLIMGTIASQITSLTIVYSTVYSDADQRKHQSSVSLAFVWGIHRGPVNSPYKWPVTRKMFPFDDVIMGAHKHLGLCLGCVIALAYGSCRVSDQGTTLRASDLHNAGETIRNPFNKLNLW